MAYGTNKKTRSTIQRFEVSIDKKTGKKTVKKYPAKEMKFKSITEKEFNSNGKTKAVPSAKKSSPTPSGTYMTFPNGRVGRTNGMYGPYESMDTTGYSKGKKTFDLIESRPGLKPNKKTISRSEVPATISRLKKGATGVLDKKSKSKSK